MPKLTLPQMQGLTKITVPQMVTKQLTCDLTPFVVNPELADPKNHEDVEMSVSGHDTLIYSCQFDFTILEIAEITKHDPPVVISTYPPKAGKAAGDSPLTGLKLPQQATAAPDGTYQMNAGRATRKGRFAIKFQSNGRTIQEVLDPCLDIGP